jgi:N-sulfoglucosamine sulfohydrolase
MLFEQLDRVDKTNNTMVIYLGDHGPDLARGKKTCYEGGVRVPLLVSFPGRLPQGKVDDHLVSTVDLLPTVLEAVGIDAPAGLPGKSLLPLLSGRTRVWRDYLFTEYTVHMPSVYYPSRTVRDARYKLIHSLLPQRPSPVYHHYLVRRQPPHLTPEDLLSAPAHIRRAYDLFRQPPELELYDLQKDPWEFNDLAADPGYAAVLKRLKKVLGRWREETNDPLRHPTILDQFSAEMDAVHNFERHEYTGVKYRRDGFEWAYPRYFFEHPPAT